jgi:hypothetical protein
MHPEVADKWIRFLREYAPIPRQSNMYAEEIIERAEKMGITPLLFEHPAKKMIRDRFDPPKGKISNVILTGTAGDGKTQLLYEMWQQEMGQDKEALKKIPKFLECDADTPDGKVKVVFVFDLSKCVPETGQVWNDEQIELVERIARGLVSPDGERFLVAANDGKLLQALRSIKERRPDSAAAEVEPEIEDMLARKREASDKLTLYLLDLGSLQSADVLDRARSALLERAEWACFEACSANPAYGPESPLYKNFKTLSSNPFYSRLRTLVELCDVNGLHISVRDVIAVLVNGLLGHPHAKDHVMTPENLREFSQSKAELWLGMIYRNILGENFPEHQRDEVAAFAYLRYFRLGQETSNQIDELLLFGKDLEKLRPTYQAIVEDPDDAVSPSFETLRREYLEAEDFADRKRNEFMDELAAQRRRLFFRIPESKAGELDPWRLTIFQSAGVFLKDILYPLREGRAVDDLTLEKLIRGFNRIWGGMLFEEGSHLFLTSGLDFTSARICRLALHKVPVAESFHGEKIEIQLNDRGQPELLVYLLSDQPARYRLDLMRVEFLMRVADGALPNSFSRECYEDIIGFKGLLLRRLQTAGTGRRRRQLNYLSLDEAGRPKEELITL